MTNDSMNEARQTLYEIFAGIVLMALLECIAGVIVSENIGAFIAGTVLGSFAAGVFYMHLFISLGKVLDKTEKDAIRYSKICTVIRMVLMGAVIVIAFTFYEHISVIMTFVGMMNVKFTAYLQPLTHKCINKLNKRKVE